MNRYSLLLINEIINRHYISYIYIENNTTLVKGLYNGKLYSKKKTVEILFFANNNKRNGKKWKEM